MKSSICLLIASSVLALAAPTPNKEARTIYTYAVKDYENDKDAVAARTIYTYAVKDYENDKEAQAEPGVAARTIYTYAVKDYKNDKEAEK